MSEEYATAWGFADTVYGYLYAWEVVSGFTQRDIEKLDPARPIPAGLDEVAELLYNAGRSYYSNYYYDYSGNGRRVFGGTHFLRSHAARVSGVGRRAARPRPRSAQASLRSDGRVPQRRRLARAHARGGGRGLLGPARSLGPPVPRSSSASKGRTTCSKSSATAWTSARALTTTSARRASRGPTSEKSPRRLNAPPRRTTRARAATSATFRRSPKSCGARAWTRKACATRGGSATRSSSTWTASYYSITVRSSGPNKSFERRDAEGSDDFTLSTTLTDYFADTNAVIDLALARALHESGYFPENDAELRVALKRRKMDFDSLRDALGNRVYANFTSGARYADRNVVEYRAGVGDDRDDVHPGHADSPRRHAAQPRPRPAEGHR